MRPSPVRDRTSLGNILVELGHTTDTMIARALMRKERLGDALVAIEAVTPEQLEEALLYQRVYRGEVSGLEACRAHKNKRRRLMADVIDGLRDMARLTNDMAQRLK